MDRLWRTIFAPIFTSLSRNVVVDHCSTSTGNAKVRSLHAEGQVRCMRPTRAPDEKQSFVGGTGRV